MGHFSPLNTNDLTVITDLSKRSLELTSKESIPNVNAITNFRHTKMTRTNSQYQHLEVHWRSKNSQKFDETVPSVGRSSNVRK